MLGTFSHDNSNFNIVGSHDLIFELDFIGPHSAMEKCLFFFHFVVYDLIKIVAALRVILQSAMN